jgi:hypothetical protein
MASVEQQKSYHVVKQFKGVNTKADRTAIDPEEFAWLENLMPIGYGNLRSVPKWYVTGVNFAPLTVVGLFSASINNKAYLINFLSDGSAVAIDPTTYVGTTIASAGTFSLNADFQICQWKSERILILDQAKGYFTWDGTYLVKIGSVAQIGITNGGINYTSAPVVTISAPNQAGGVQARAVCTISGNAVNSITLIEAGSGYTSPPTITFSGGGGSNAAAIASVLTFATGTVSATVTNGGTGYTSAPTVSFSGGGGTGAAGTAIISGGSVTQIIMTNPGSGYTSNPTVTLSGGGGTGATATAVANVTPNTAIQSFSGRTWIAAGRTVFYSAAGSYSDFVTVSAGNITISDSTLLSSIRQMLSANNFLYIFGDTSINVFSDVRVTSTGSTIFTNTNVSASVGTNLSYAIFPYFRSILFMNPYGVYALVGATTTKISDALDGIFPDLDFITEETTGGQVLLNNILCAVFNVRYKGTKGVSPGPRYMQLVFFDKKWFFTSATDDMKYIAPAFVNGFPVLYGTNGSNLIQLYASTTASPINSYVQTALDSMGDPIRTKQALKVGLEATLSGGAQFAVTVDSEKGSSATMSLGGQVNWLNNSSQPINWVNNSSTVIYWYGGSGYTLFKSDAKQWGKYLGMTITSSDPGIVINGFQYEHELRTRF